MCLRRRGAVAGPSARGSSSVIPLSSVVRSDGPPPPSHASLACVPFRQRLVDGPLQASSILPGARAGAPGRQRDRDIGTCGPTRSPLSHRAHRGRDRRAGDPRRVPARDAFPGAAAAATGTPGAAGSPAPSHVAVQPSPDASPTASPPAPEPTPVLVPAPLTGVLVSPEVAAQHPIAVMVDDQFYARPQSGFNAASVVWHAPAEGGIPRYMLIFQDQIAAGRSGRSAARACTTSSGRPSGTRCTSTPAARPRRSGS